MHLRVRQRRTVFRVFAVAAFLAVTAVIWGLPHSSGPIEMTRQSMMQYRRATAYGVPGWLVHPEYRGGERGARLLRELEQAAVGLGLSEVFVLTTQTAHWFIEQGFEASSLDRLPPEKQALYNLQRNSKVFIKTCH